MRVLLAEDDALLREILCDSLAEQGFTVVAAADGQDALKRFRASGPSTCASRRGDAGHDRDRVRADPGEGHGCLR